jgi:hypothetical protein
MRLVLAALCLFAYASAALAETQLDLNQLSASQPIKGSAASPDVNKEQAQPQGPTGPLTTGSGGTTAASPQGGTPANMQAAPTVRQRTAPIRSNPAAGGAQLPPHKRQAQLSLPAIISPPTGVDGQGAV